MTASLEQIEMLRARANVSYAEAREALEKCDGDTVEALIYLEKQGKTRNACSEDAASSFFATIKTWVRSCNQTRFIVSKKDNTLINLSVTIVIIAAIFAFPVVLIGLLAALFTFHKIRLEKPGAPDMKINQTLDNISEAVSSVSSHMNEVIKNS